jgi:1,4-dihydroxy-2-naphthoate octaprenyltransferase
MNEDILVWPARARIWLMAIRPLTLSLAGAPVMLGAALAMGRYVSPDWFLLAVTLLAALAIQAGANLLNDAADGERGEDGPGRKGPLRVTGAGLLSSDEVRRGAWIAFFIAALAGLYLVWRGGWPIMLAGAASVFAGYSYSGGSRPLSHSPLGELVVTLFFGLLAVSFTFYLQAGYIAGETVLAGVGLGSMAAAALFVNNVRDIGEDRRAGRHTFAIIAHDMAARAGRSEQGRRDALAMIYASMIFFPFLLHVIQPLLAGPRPYLHWLPLLLLPAAMMAVQSFLAAGGKGYNRILMMTISLHASFALLLSIAFALT